MSQNIATWEPIFGDPEMVRIIEEIEGLLEEDWRTGTVLPEKNFIFSAFEQCAFPPKVVIIGQNPYFSNIDEAMGLSFSVPVGVKIPLALKIYLRNFPTNTRNL